MKLSIPPPVKSSKLKIHVFCPACSLAGINIQATVEELAKYEFELILPEEMDFYHGYLAGTPQMRISHIDRLFKKDDVRIMMAGRGGFGSSHIINSLDYHSFKQNPKWIVGYSDVCFLLFKILRETGIATIHGPMLIDFSHKPKSLPVIISCLKKIIGGETITYEFGSRASLNTHPLPVFTEIKGWVIPANLSILNDSLGTDYLPDLPRIILILEDVDEPLYRLERMLIHLTHTPFINRISAVILGKFTRLKKSKHKASFTELAKGIFSQYGIHVFEGFPIGHASRNFPVLMGGAGILTINPDRPQPFKLTVSPP